LAISNHLLSHNNSDLSNGYFLGSLIATFNLELPQNSDILHLEEALYLDFGGKEILNLKINGQEINDTSFDSEKIFLPIDLLNFPQDELNNPTPNTVSVDFLSRFRKDGNGFYTSTDDSDG
jgi:hypothetical protein